MTKALTKEIVVKMRKETQLFNRIGWWKEEKWKNVSTILDSAALHMGISHTKMWMVATFHIFFCTVPLLLPH